MNTPIVTTIENNLTDDKARRCGHNFYVNDCPYKICGYRYAVEQWEKALKERNSAQFYLVVMTDTERVDLFNRVLAQYCRHCGRDMVGNNGNCQCGNDE